MASANPENTRSNPTKALNHLECLVKLCAFCHQKGNVRLISADLVKKIKDNSIIENLEALHNPRSICNSCRVDLNVDFKKNPNAPEIIKCLKLRRSKTQPSADELISITLDGECKCRLCKIVKSNAPPPRKANKRSGRPPKPSNTMVCSKCYSEDCDGKNCKTSGVKKSATNLIKNNPSVAQAVTSQIIKNTKPSPKGTIRLAQGSGGGELPVTIGSSAKKAKKVEVTAKEMNKMRQNLGIGNKAMRDVTSFINKKFGRGTVESGHQEKLVQMTHVVDGHFALDEECEFMDSDKKLVRKPLVYCKNLSEFVMCIISGRGYDLEATVILFNVDNSDDFSEYFITIIDLNEDPNAPLKSSGSAYSLIVAVSPKVPENNFNFKKVLNIIKAHEVKMQYACDLKADASLIGIQSAACTHPCIYCTTDDLSKCGDPRTIGSLCEDHQKFLDSKLDRKHLKDFNNCEYFPLITNDFENDWDKQILDLVPPPGLHIMLGIVNQQVKLLEGVIPALVEEWVAYSQAARVSYHGGIFEGNACKSLVDNIDYLSMLVMNGPSEHFAFAMSIIDVLRKFGKMRHSCYAKTLQPDFETHIDNYATSLDNVVSDHDVSTILKNHIAKFHVKPWCQRNNIGLGARSEQTPEASHKRFKKVWLRLETTKGSMGKRLLKTACVYNSENAHLIIATIYCPHTTKIDQN